jgi:hypothetical protein
MKLQLVAALLLGMASLAHAHFVWGSFREDGATAQIFISEELKPSEEVDVGIIGGTKLSLRDAGGTETSLTLTKAALPIRRTCPEAAPVPSMESPISV